MIKPKISLIRIEDTRFDDNKLLSDIILRSKIKLGNKGRIYDDQLGSGFSVSIGKPKTLREYFYIVSSFAEQSGKRIKNLLDE